MPGATVVSCTAYRMQGGAKVAELFVGNHSGLLSPIPHTKCFMASWVISLTHLLELVVFESVIKSDDFFIQCICYLVH